MTENGQHGEPPQVVNPTKTPFSINVTQLPDGNFAIQLFLLTGTVVLFTDKGGLEQMENVLHQVRSGIVVPGPGQVLPP